MGTSYPVWKVGVYRMMVKIKDLGATLLRLKSQIIPSRLVTLAVS